MEEFLSNFFEQHWETFPNFQQMHASSKLPIMALFLFLLATCGTPVWRSRNLPFRGTPVEKHCHIGFTGHYRMHHVQEQPEQKIPTAISYITLTNQTHGCNFWQAMSRK